MTDFRFTADDAEVIRALERIEAAFAASGKKVEGTITGFFDTKEADDAVKLLGRLQDEYDKLKKSADTLKSALKNSTDPALIKSYAENVAKLERGMKDLEKAGAAVGVNLKEANKQAGTGRQVFENFFGTFTKASLIIAAIEAVVKFTKYSVELSQSISKASRQFEAFTGNADQAQKIVNRLIATGQKNFIPTDDILQAGKALLAFGEGADNLEAVLTRIANISAATGKDFNELTTIYGKARAAGVLYAEDINQLVDAGIPIIQEFAKQMNVSNDQVKKLASEGKISFEQLQLAFFNLTAAGGKFADQSAVQAETISGAWQKLVASIQPAAQKIGEFFTDIIKGAIYLLTDLSEGIKGLFSDKKAKIEVDYTGRDAYEKAKEDLFERQRLEKEAAESSKNRAKKTAAELAQIERERNRLRLEAMQEGEAKDIAAENLRFDELKKALKKYHIDTAEAELQHQKNLVEISVRYANERAQEYEKLLDLRRAQAEYEQKQAKDAVEREKRRVEGLKDVQSTEVDITEAEFANIIAALEAGGAKKAEVEKKRDELERAIKARRIQIEIDYQRGLLNTIEAGNEQERKAIENRIQTLQTQLDGLAIPLPKTDGKGGGFNFNDWLLSRLGIDEQGADAIKQAFGQVIDSLDQIAEARIREAESATRAAEEKVRAAEDALKGEEDAAKKGFANNSDLRRKELEEAKKQRDAALKEEAKAKKSQIALDTVSQVSGLITSSANIFKSLSALGPIGIGIAVATIGVMLGAFAKAKADALKAAEPPKLRKGKRFDGPTHEQGNEDLVSNGRKVYAVEKDEWLIGTEPSREHDSFLAKLNAGHYRGINLESIVASAKSDSGAAPLRAAVSSIERVESRKRELEGDIQYRAMERAYRESADRIVSEIREKPTYAPWKDGYKKVVETEGGTITTTVLPG